MSERPGLVVIGAGAAGLAAGLEARARGVEVAVLEAADRAGGVMQTDTVQGYRVERGPNTIQVKAPALELLRREGLEAALLRAAPASRARWLLRGGRLVPVPMSPGAFARTPLLSGRGKLRILKEPFVPRRKEGPEGEGAAPETVAEFVARRLGPEVVDALVGPFLTGVYAGDERALGAEAVFPALVALEREHGSLLVGGVARALAGLRGRSPRGLPGTWSSPEGLGGLAARMGEALGPALHLRHRVRALAKDGPGFALEVEGPEGSATWRTPRVVVATEAGAAARLLEGLDRETTALLDALPFAPLASLALGVEPATLATPPEGFGFLVPRGEDAAALGILYPSALFPRRAPPERALLAVMLGGLRRPELVDAPEAELRELVVRDLARILGLRGEPEWLLTTRWPRAVPQPPPGHVRRVGAAKARLAALGRLAVAGAWVAGVGVSDTLASGRDAVSRALA